MITFPGADAAAAARRDHDCDLGGRGGADGQVLCLSGDGRTDGRTDGREEEEHTMKQRLSKRNQRMCVSGAVPETRRSRGRRWQRLIG